MFIRVKDPSTGHEFDVPEKSSLLRKGLVKPVNKKHYPPSQYPRRAKHHIALAPKRADVAAPELAEEPLRVEPSVDTAAEAIPEGDSNG